MLTGCKFRAENIGRQLSYKTNKIRLITHDVANMIGLYPEFRRYVRDLMADATLIKEAVCQAVSA